MLISVDEGEKEEDKIDTWKCSIVIISLSFFGYFLSPPPPPPPPPPLLVDWA